MGKRVLVVDDEAQVGRLAVKVLFAAGHDVVLATSFEEGRKKALTETYDVLVTDLTLNDGQNGAKLALDASNHDHGLRIVVISSVSLSSALDVFDSARVNRSIVKRIVEKRSPTYAKDLREAVGAR